MANSAPPRSRDYYKEILTHYYTDTRVEKNLLKPEIKMQVKDFTYELPQELIAQYPLEPRDHSRLLVVDKKYGNNRTQIFFMIYVNICGMMIYWFLMIHVLFRHVCMA